MLKIDNFLAKLTRIAGPGEGYGVYHRNSAGSGKAEVLVQKFLTDGWLVGSLAC